MTSAKIKEDKIDGDTIYIYDYSGDEFKILKKIVFVSKDGEQKYRLQKSKIRQAKSRKYSMQK